MRRGFRSATSAAFVATLVVLGLVGWSIGWLAADSELRSQNQPTSAPTNSDKPSSPTAAPPVTSSPTPISTSSRRADAFSMPKLVGKQFRDARAEAIKLKLGVSIKFNQPSDKPAGTVVKQTPEESVYVWPSIEAILYVAGPVPATTVPDVTGKPCDTVAKDDLLTAGLLIKDYPSGRNGKVDKTEPPALAAAVWNQQVRVYCSAS